MSAYIEFDPFTKNQNQRPPLAKVAKMAKEQTDFSHFSHFSQPPPLESDYCEAAVETFDSAVAFSEITSFPVRLLFEIPLPPSLVLTVPGIDEPVILDFRHRPAGMLRRSKRRLLFDVEETGALLFAAEYDRVRPNDFVRFCNHKLTPAWRLTREEALAEAVELLQNPSASKNWTTGQFLHRLNVELRLIEI